MYFSHLHIFQFWLGFWVFVGLGLGFFFKVHLMIIQKWTITTVKNNIHTDCNQLQCLSSCVWVGDEHHGQQAGTFLVVMGVYIKSLKVTLINSHQVSIIFFTA